MTRKNRIWITRGGMAIFAALFLVLGWAQRARFSPADPGTPVPAYRAVSLDGDTVSLSDFAGKVVLLNVWATWCRPCVREMPSLQRLYDRYRDQGLEVVAVSVDAALPLIGQAADVAGFASELGLSFRILRDPGGNIERIFNVTALPVTIVITRDGRIHEKVLGERPWDEARHATQIEALLAS